MGAGHTQQQQWQCGQEREQRECGTQGTALSRFCQGREGGGGLKSSYARGGGLGVRLNAALLLKNLALLAPPDSKAQMLRAVSGELILELLAGETESREQYRN